MDDNKCVFCKIINKEIPTDFIYKDNDVYVFRDINPKAPTHLLVVPRVHIKTLLYLSSNHLDILTKLIKVIQTLVKSQKLQAGYRIVLNGGRHQEIGHLHFHLLGD